MNDVFAEARRLGLNGGAAAAVDAKQVSAVASLLGYSAAPDAGSGHGTGGLVRYRIHWFHFEPLAVSRLSASGCWVPVEEGMRPSDRRLRRAEKAGWRILYALGIDFGMTEVEAGPNGAVPLAVDPFPETDEALLARYRQALERFRAAWIRECGRTTPAVLGADPEFLLKSASGRVVPASAFLPRRGSAGCDLVRIGERALYPLAELRPEPSPDPRRLVVHIHKALRTAASHIPDRPDLQWVAGGMPARGFALGGHIHLSGVWLNVFLLRALDNYLALPVALVEDGRASARRPRYGVPGDFRLKPHGGFEYRTLPSWLVSPRVAKGALALASVIADRYRELDRMPLSDPDCLRAFLEGDKAKLSAAVRPLLAELRRLPEYDRHERMIEPLFAMIARGESWDESRDFRAGWKIPVRLPDSDEAVIH
jgi:hypothetical protein